MRRNQLVMLVGWVTLAIAGCAGEEAPPPATTSPAPQAPAAASPSPAPSPPAGQGQTPGTQPLTTQRPAPAPPVAGLIPSTNAQEREKQVRTETNTGRAADPFAALPPTLPTPTTTNRPVPNVAQLPNNRPGGTGNNPGRPQPTNPGNQGNGRAGRGGQTPVTVAGIPPQRAIGESPTIPRPEGGDEGAIGAYIPPVRPAAPPAPTADLAKALQVTGVVVVGSTPQAIVQVPEEPSSRYVSVGQRLSNGRVLVKRIEINPGGEPVVVFEQNGIEVAKSVGSSPAPQDKEEKVS